MSKITYFVSGMHCHSCELILETNIKELAGVTAVRAALKKNLVEIEYEQEKPSLKLLNQTFIKGGYVFSNEPLVAPKNNWRAWVAPMIIAAVVILIFLGLNRVGVISASGLVKNSPLGAFFLFGVLAGLSSCAALVGGLLLSLSKQWSESYSSATPVLKKTQPYFLFNFGRLLSFFLFGLLLGEVGQKIQFSVFASSVLVVIVSIFMVMMGLQMLGVRKLNHFRLSLPKKFTQKITTARSGNSSALVIGFLTILLPCGFTLVAESLTIIAGSPLRGGLMLLLFALGTALPLLIIGIFSAEMINSKWGNSFLKIAGILVLFFASYNLNFQFNLKSYLTSSGQPKINAVVAAPAGTQILKTVYTNKNDIQPSVFEVKVGKPARLMVEVVDSGYGCMSTIMVPGLYNKPILLKKGQTIIMDFTPPKTGEFQITCAMGVPRGIIKVVN
ncbi:MAG: sulfite exporter TauE/SafE family protein [Patescibacteria group bacterium]|nr:sulfite exporter TauE/SafE family protein [Patescibacteria group bacterium]